MQRTLVFDTEVYPNFFLLAISTLDGKKRRYFSSPFTEETRLKIKAILTSYTLIGFNSINFDLPLLTMLCDGASTEELYEAANDIIDNGLRSWQFYKKYNLRELDVDHIDLIEVAPGKSSLKLYGAKLHAKKLQDLPIAPGTILSSDQKRLIVKYCYNDLDLTTMLWNQLEEAVQLRISFGRAFRSKSDAQVAEKLISDSYERMTGRRPDKPKDRVRRFRHKPMPWINFKTHRCNEALSFVRKLEFDEKRIAHFIADDDKVKLPIVNIDGQRYKMGTGGLHSMEKMRAIEAPLRDIDFASYYPKLLMQMAFKYKPIYGKLIERRLAAKDAGRKVEADGLKIAVNGTFGKLGSFFSFLYDPELLVRVTLSGQLTLLMLIEELTLNGYSVYSANTDGIVILDKPGVDSLLAEFETKTGLKTESAFYKGLYSRDVNNYVALKQDGGVKLKGVFSSKLDPKNYDPLKKNPQFEICQEAVVNFLRNGDSIDETIIRCSNIEKFVSVRNVKGSAEWNGQYLGRVARWYWATDSRHAITYRSNGNKVPKSDGSRPLLDLEWRNDIDYGRYIREARNLLWQVGVQDIGL